MAPAQAQHAHAELIDALTELYTLLDTLGALSPLDSDPGPDYDSDTATPTANVLLPPNPASSINAIAATAAGFAPETVSVMSKLPFLTSDYTYSHGDGYELMPSTYPLSYLGEDLDEGGFESRRELLSDQVMPPTALKLTQSDVYGVEWIYDVATGLLTPWKPFDDGLSDTNDYSHIAALPRRDVIGPLIDHYRRHDYIATPSGEVDFSSPLFADAPLDPATGEAQPPRDWGPADAARWRAQYAVWRTTRGIKDLYLECGWDVQGREQPGFQRDEFLHKRAVYWAEVVEPLVQAEAEL